MLFNDLPLQRRPAAVAQLGLNAIEMRWPFSDRQNRTAAAKVNLSDAIEHAGVKLVSLNFDSGDDKGLFCISSSKSHLAENIESTIEFGAELGCKKFNALFGNSGNRHTDKKAWDTAVDNYRRACTAAKEVDGTVMIEPINTPDAPSYGIRSVKAALRLIEEVDMGTRLGILLDVYRLHLDQSGIEQSIHEAGASIAHVQLADSPGRSELGSGTIDFSAVIRALSSVGYRGHLGLEFEPSTDSQSAIKRSLIVLQASS